MANPSLEDYMNSEDWKAYEKLEEEIKIKILGDQEKCPICLDEMGDTVGAAWILPCYHKFHKKCLDNIVNTGGRTCPVCRQEIECIRRVCMCVYGECVCDF